MHFPNSLPCDPLQLQTRCANAAKAQRSEQAAHYQQGYETPLSRRSEPETSTFPQHQRKTPRMLCTEYWEELPQQWGINICLKTLFKASGADGAPCSIVERSPTPVDDLAQRASPPMSLTRVSSLCPPHRG